MPRRARRAPGCASPLFPLSVAAGRTGRSSTESSATIRTVLGRCRVGGPLLSRRSFDRLYCCRRCELCQNRLARNGGSYGVAESEIARAAVCRLPFAAARRFFQRGRSCPADRRSRPVAANRRRARPKRAPDRQVAGAEGFRYRRGGRPFSTTPITPLQQEGMAAAASVPIRKTRRMAVLSRTDRPSV